MMDIFCLAGLRGEVIKPVDAHIAYAMEHDSFFHGKRGGTNTADQHGRFQQLDFLGGNNVSIDLAAADNGFTGDLALHDPLFTNHEGILRHNVTVKMSVDSDTAVEFGFSYEVHTFPRNV